MKKLVAVLLAVVLPSFANAWQYEEQADQMRGSKDSFAYVTSLNKVDFAFPYNGGSTMDVQLRKSKKYGKDVMLIISKGQFSCGMGCSVNVKFDDGKVERFSASGATNGASDIIFINSYSQFVSKLKKSKRLFVEADFYNSGSKQMQFDIAGLKWE